MRRNPSQVFCVFLWLDSTSENKLPQLATLKLGFSTALERQIR
ncbi:hypothetical protein CWATWH8502_1884 [Crocosphaera watsonii WH 8502]|uniref:Uncharacterized protein n=2 Tax=Crocosphaera watsonii TaxID=263511 RepID=T2IR67_CROWT|nr:hypothetical protein CWATWH8502_1884 [Crocosphaera watsonii WH 8502]CCQ55508.1 hypothetical protein CWATWH0005_791 [Crocosphaera watsonii WH 0005]